MRRLGIITLVAVMAAVLTATPVTVAKKTVNVPVASLMELANATTTQQASTVSISVPVIVVSDAGAECDPSDGRHPGLAWSCFLEWLMEVFDASSSPY